jgi:uncharacterized protein YggE
MARILWMLVAVLVPATGALAQTAADRPVIVTDGRAVLERSPDVAWVSIAAETRAAEPSAAQQGAASAMTAVRTALAGARIAEDAIRTTGYSLRPDVERAGGRTRVIGYIARNQIEVRVEDLDRIGPVIDAAGASGASSMSGLRFDLTNRAEVEREALRLAVEDARARAEAMAAGAGVQLGPIVRIDEQRQGPPVAYQRDVMMMQASAPVETPISAGTIEVSAQVTLTVQIR